MCQRQTRSQTGVVVIKDSTGQVTDKMSLDNSSTSGDNLGAFT